MASVTIQKGEAQVLFAYDVGFSIDLAATKDRLARGAQGSEAAEIKHRGHAPTYFQFDPTPLRVVQSIGAIEIGRCTTKATVEIVVYDFGGVSICYDLPYQGPLDGWLELSCELAASTHLREDSLERVRKLVAAIEPAVVKASIAPITEDYVVFLVEEMDPPIAPEELVRTNAATIARILRAEHDVPSDQEIADATSTRVSFGTSDVAVIDWNAALLVDKESEDVRAVLEFANLQLLELRYLDDELDRALDRAYELIGRRRGIRRLRMPGGTRANLARVARMQVDSAILFERVHNVLKLVGDQYLARVYRGASQRFRLQEWNTTLLRKLETIENIYDKIHDQSTELRMEVLEWIIILLIAFEIVSPWIGITH